MRQGMKWTQLFLIAVGTENRRMDAESESLSESASDSMPGQPEWLLDMNKKYWRHAAATLSKSLSIAIPIPTAISN